MKFPGIFTKENDRDIAERMKHAAQITMDDASRERMRAHLFEYTKVRPVRSATSRVANHNQLLAFLSHIRPMPVVAALLIVVLSGSTVAASENALPGDILYSIKVHVTEEVRASLAVSPKAKADWALARAERRLEEAATLELAGNLDEVTRAEIDTNLDEHVLFASENGQKLGESERASITEIEDTIAAVRIARENVFGQHPKSLAANVEAEIAVPEVMTMSTVFEAPQEKSVVVQRMEIIEKPEVRSRGNRTAARVRIDAAKKFLETRKNLNEKARAEVAEQIKIAADTLSSGDDKASRGDEEDAASEFKHALEEATEAGILLSKDTDESAEREDASGF